MAASQRRRTLFFCTLMMFASSAVQADNLDQSKLIDALAERGMDELLLHLAQSSDFDDPAEARLIEIGQLGIAARDNSLAPAQRRDAFDRGVAALRQLIDDPQMDGHPLRPVWRTDLAQMLLVQGLVGMHRSANGFYEFGVPTADQRQAFEQMVPVALAMTLQADSDFLDLETRLSRDPALRDQLEVSLVYYRIFEEYRDQKSAYFGAVAAYYTALLPDKSPYYQSLGVVAGQGKTPAAERKRLLGLALRKLGPFTDANAGNTALRERAQSLAGRATLAMGEAAAADRKWLTPATRSTQWNLDRLGASIAKAKALEAQGKFAAAKTLLEGLQKKSAVRDRLNYRLLASDALHLLLLRRADALPSAERGAAIEQAYGVYFELLDDPSLGDRAGALRNLVFDRWASSLGKDAGADEVAALPATVRMAVADISRRRGLVALRQGEKEDGQRWLRRAIEAAQTLNDRAAVGDAVWANGQYNLAYAKYGLEPGKLAVLLEVVGLATQVAEATPDLPVATDAIELAARIVEPLHRRYAQQPGVTPAFERAMRVLYESGDFDTTKPADDRRVYYAYAVFEANGDYEKAVAIYDKQLQTHPNYLQAQAQRVAALTQWYLETPAGAQRNAIESDLLDAATRAEALGTKARAGGGDAYRLASAGRVLANGRLASAQVYATRGALDRALSAIENFEDDFAEQPALIQEGLKRRILLLVEAGQLTRAQDAAGAMMGRFPDAAASVINNVLNDTQRRITLLGDDSPESAKLADAAAAMAKLLVDWAQEQGFDAGQMLPYHLVVLKSLRIADRPAEALAYLKDSGLERDFGNNVDVLFEKAQALVTQGDSDSLHAAAPLLNRILGGLNEPYPPVYWQAWVARLRINLLLNEKVGDVPRRVRQLKVRFPDLGGPATRRALEALAAEAQQKTRP